MCEIAHTDVGRLRHLEFGNLNLTRISTTRAKACDIFKIRKSLIGFNPRRAIIFA